ncbi:hypothetical protein NUM3379_35250 [Kineococcus sp. NUM-3379]
MIIQTSIEAAGIVMNAMPMAVPNPPAEQPPGTEGLLTALGYFKWIVTALALVGLGLIAAQMMMAHRRGEGTEIGQALGWFVGGTSLFAAGSQILDVLL